MGQEPGSDKEKGEASSSPLLPPPATATLLIFFLVLAVGMFFCLGLLSSAVIFLCVLSFSLRTFSLLLLRPPLIRAAYHYGRETGKEAKKNEKKSSVWKTFARDVVKSVI